jgi:hypothetical protein
MKARQGSRIGKIFADGRQIDEALRLAARDAIRKHALHDAPIDLARWPHRVGARSGANLEDPAEDHAKRQALI